MAADAPRKIVASNRRARFDYELGDRFEAGLVLTGSEVKSLRAGQAHLQEAFVAFAKDGVDLVGSYIAPYEHGGYSNHVPTRKRRLLLHDREIDKLRKGVEQKGFTIVPLSLYFTGGRAKVEVALARGKKTHDKRHATAERDTARQLDRIRKGDTAE